ncbi:MAG TPA: AmmeMemoRadiSam system protein A [Syntrophomonadaceae bacterium]|nr:AmmeMemoRadiSam system protein A [Syntrophomonadaceae bacterium]
MISYAALAPHPPLIIPDVGGARINDVSATVSGMRQMAQAVVESKPETIIFLTPHGNVFADCLSVLTARELRGGMASFGSRWEGGAPNDLELVKKIAEASAAQDIGLVLLDSDTAKGHHLNTDLDHGILVPFYYLQEAGLENVSLVAISIGFISELELYSFGQLIQQAARGLNRRVVVLASGDMSHRLKNDGPYDFHPDGPVFDQTIYQYLAGKQVQAILKMPEKLRSNAGECGFRSIVIMLGALDGLEIEASIFSYEGPFGVGYLTAGFQPGARKDSLLAELQAQERQARQAAQEQESLQVKWARMVLENYVTKGDMPSLPPELNQLVQEEGAVFVSLKKNGQLRGCIGTILPAYDNLAEEIAANAVSAGTRDPRFLPLSSSELDSLVYSVDVLGTPQSCRREELNPKRYGVIVKVGNRRGVLLPDLEGVDTVEEQLNIALQKAGIKPNEDYEIERFEVKRYH